MSTYFFETITAAQALAFDGQVDRLVFTNPAATGANTRVTFNPATATSQASLTVLDVTTGHVVVFGVGLEGLRFPVYPNGSALGVSIPSGAEFLDSPLGDGNFGLAGPDTLHGLGGDDVLQGGQGADVLDGGAGSDLFLVAAGDSPAAVGQMDTVIDWSSADRLSFVFGGGTLLTPAGNASNYVETTAGSFSAALATANAQIAGGVVEYVSVQVGGDVIVFADDNGDHGAADDAVILRGQTLANIDASNIVFGVVAPHATVGLPISPPPVSPPPPPISPPPPPTNAHGVTAVIGGDLDFTQLSHLLDSGVVSASSTLLSLQDGGSGLSLGGFGFTIDANGDLTGGTLTTIDFHLLGGPHAHIEGLSLPVVNLIDSLSWATNAQILDAIFDGNDSIVGDSGPNHLVGHGGYDTITGGGGADVFEVVQSDSAASLGSGGHPERLDHITDWTSSDFLQFTDGPAMTANGYVEVTASSFDQALNIAVNDRFGSTPIPYVVAQVGGDVIVFGGQIINAVVLTGRTLADISQANVGPDPFAATPPPPPGGGVHTGATVDLFDGSDMGTFQESSLSDAVVTRTPTLEHLTFAGGTAQMSITGVGLTYDSSGALSGGTVTGVEVTSPNGHFVLAGAHTDGSILGQAYHTNDANLSISSLLSGDDVITVRSTTLPATDTSFTGMGFGGNDLLVGGGSLSTLFGGDGNDTVQAGSAASSYLRGDSGDDSLSGGAGFDDINGNMGNDTAHGNAGDDWVVGGKDNDMLFGDAGSDIVWGNLGNDTLDGGDGNDQVRGGQGDDSVSGGAGDDYVSGDRGNDTITGGPGADLFHTSQDAGIDKVLDFNLSEGDRVMLDPGTTYSVSQVGADTVINMGAGNQMILVGVQLSTLTPGWIFGA